jgi:hypothetical protein
MPVWLALRISNLISIRSSRGHVKSRRPQNEPVPFPRGGKDVNLARFYGHADRRWPARLSIWKRERGHDVPAGCEHTAIMLVPWNVRGPFSVDRQSNEKIASEIWRALHDQPTGRMSMSCRPALRRSRRGDSCGTSRLNFSARRENCADQSQNERVLAEELSVHPPKLARIIIFVKFNTARTWHWSRVTRHFRHILCCRILV